MITIEYDQKDIQRQLLELEDGLQGKAVRSALTAAIKPILADMKSGVPIDEGSLRRSLGRATLSKRAKGRLGVAVEDVAILIGPNRKVADRLGARRGQGYKAIWAEYGTEDRDAKPFMGPAFDSNISQVESNFYSGLQKYINKVSQ